MDNPQDLPNFPPSATKPDPVQECKNMLAKHMRYEHDMTLAEIGSALDIDIYELKDLFNMPQGHTNFNELKIR
jgi:hypothetical protein